MKEEHIEQTVKDEKPDIIILSFLSTTAYLVMKSMAQRLKKAAPKTPKKNPISNKNCFL